MRRGLLIAPLLATLVTPPAGARSPLIKLAEVEAAGPLSAGTTAIDEIGVAYLPPDLSGPVPLLLLFHGAGMTASGFLDGMKQEADQCRCMLLAIQSEGRTWDLIVALADAQRKAGRRELGSIEFGEDLARVERGLAQMIARSPVDRSRVVPVGFSDGASYALSVALANPRLFRSAVAIAPGFVNPPPSLDASQRLFIAHGKDDPVLPFNAARAAVVSPLQAAGYHVRFKPFAGGHYVDRQSLQEGISFALGQKGRT